MNTVIVLFGVLALGVWALAAWLPAATMTGTLTVILVRHDDTGWVTRSVTHPLTDTGLLAAGRQLLTQAPDDEGWRVSSLNASR